MAPIAIPTSADELESLLANPVKAGELVKEGQLGDVVKAYAQHVVKTDANMRDQVREQVQQITAEFFRDNGQELVGRPSVADLGRITKDRGAAYNKEAPGAALDSIFNSREDYLRAVWFGNQSEQAMGLKAKVRNDYSSTVGSDGGFLVPESFRSTLMQVALEQGIVRQRAMVIPMPTSAAWWRTGLRRAGPVSRPPPSSGRSPWMRRS